MSSPRVNALAYRIHGYASPRGWDCTVAEIAEALDAPSATVRNICIKRGWNNRLRVTPREQQYNQTPFAGGITKLHEVFQPGVGIDE